MKAENIKKEYYNKMSTLMNFFFNILPYIYSVLIIENLYIYRIELSHYLKQ